MPPKAVPMSMPARARKKRASAKKPTSTMTSAIAAVGKSHGQQRDGGRSQHRGAEDDVGAAAEQPRGVVGEHQSLRNSFARVAVRLQQRGAPRGSASGT